MKDYAPTKTVLSNPLYCPVCGHAVNPGSQPTDRTDRVRMNRRGEMVTYRTRKHAACKDD